MAKMTVTVSGTRYQFDKDLKFGNVISAAIFEVEIRFSLSVLGHETKGIIARMQTQVTNDSNEEIRANLLANIDIRRFYCGESYKFFYPEKIDTVEIIDPGGILKFLGVGFAEDI